MIVTGASVSDLEAAAREVGVEVDVSASYSQRRHRFRLSPDLRTAGLDTKGRRLRGQAGDVLYQRVNYTFQGERVRRVSAVCWHGHRDFFRALYRRAPAAVLRTGVTVYRSAAHFEATHRDTWGRCHPSPKCGCPEGWVGSTMAAAMEEGGGFQVPGATGEVG